MRQRIERVHLSHFVFEPHVLQVDLETKTRDKRLGDKDRVCLSHFVFESHVFQVDLETKTRDNETKDRKSPSPPLYLRNPCFSG